MGQIAENNENGKERCSDDDTARTLVRVLNNSDFRVSCKLYDDLLTIKSKYTDIIKAIGLADTDEIGQYTNEQIDCSVKKVKKPQLAEHLSDILAYVQKICLPEYIIGSLSGATISENDIGALGTLVTSKIDEIESSSKTAISNIQSEIDKLSTSINNFKFPVEQYSASNEPPTTPAENEIASDYLSKLDVTFIDDTRDNFIDQATCDELTSLFKDHTFKQENGHQTLSFGESYNYNGSRNPPRDMPPLLQKIMSDINNLYSDEGLTPLNSCLINKYPDSKSFIKLHSDDERSINRNSNICTISIGETRTVLYHNTVTGEKHKHAPNHASLYTMSKLSQELFKHEIEPENSSELDIRYSLTFRSLSWTNHNSTIIYGDSNTENLKFGYGENTFRKSMPGERVAAYTIDQIDPLKCIGYSNVVIHCGVNDVRARGIDSNDDIRDLYNKFVGKVYEIRSVNKRANIYVSPLLPTRMHGLNRKILFYNKLIFNDLEKSPKLRVSTVVGYNYLLDNENLLSYTFARHNDYLHLSPKGVVYLAKCIKDCIFSKKQSRNQHEQHTRTPNNSEVKGGPVSGRPP